MERTVLQRKVRDGSTEKEKSFSEPGIPEIMSRSSSFGSSKKSSLIFWATIALSQLVGVACVVLGWYWASRYGGLKFSDIDLLFNFHPAFMIMGLIFFYGDAMIVYRVLGFLPKPTLKLIHTALHLGAIVFSSIALYAVLHNHAMKGFPDFYSLHSWVGIVTIAAFDLQFVASFSVFLFPGGTAKMRSMLMPIHRFFGVGIFVMAVASAGMGLTEKLLWTSNYSGGAANGRMGNALGLLILVFAFLIVYLTTHAPYKRKPLPSDAPATTN